MLLMRFEPELRILSLAQVLLGTRYGLTITDIQQRYEVSRRTAERMRLAVETVYPDLEQVNPGELPKRWRIPHAIAANTPPYSAEELSALQIAHDLSERQNLPEIAGHLLQVERKLRSQMARHSLRRVEPDLELLLESEGIALRSGPRPRIDGTQVTMIREAIKMYRVIGFDYLGRGKKKHRSVVLAPYGFLYGNRHYLIGRDLKSKTSKPKMFALSNISNTVITAEGFERPVDFTLRSFAANAFGVFQEPAIDVVWKFSASVASDVRDFLFHPTQRQEELEDGSVIVTFKAGGLREMVWHLITWGDNVEVLTPKSLKDLMQPIREWLKTIP
jgi:predicted DNA-binding transcriptional regulator YafY